MGWFQDGPRKLYIGLPQDAAEAVGNLYRQNKIGVECAPEFTANVVVGIYPLFRG